MSDAKSRSSPARHPTRQQLDDLEALMEQMLALPVNQLEDPPEVHAVPLPEPDLSAPSIATTPAPDPGAGTSHSIVEKATAALDGKKTPEAESAQFSSDMAPGRTVSHSHPLPILRRQRSATAWLVEPLVWTNLLFDHWVGRWGRLGRWLRSSRGRAVLGWFGLLCLAGAVSWFILDHLGWTR